jgi:DNA helicase-2/ATP-dependent DNA helicase PcrA
VSVPLSVYTSCRRLPICSTIYIRISSFPHRLSDDDEGERRVFHVALTRARTQVVILADAEAPSNFLAELEGCRGRPSPRPDTAGRHAGSDRERKPSGGSGQERRTSATGQGPVSGRRVGTSPAGRSGGRPAGKIGEATATVSEEALRTWRSSIAIQEAVPAYVILKDTELTGIARRDPRTLAELAACRGMGPIRLERWGDEILAILESVRST